MPPLETTQIPPPCDTLPKDLHALIHFCPQLITAVLDFRETPCIRTANACIEALGGKAMTFIGESVYCIIYEVDGKYSVYSDVVHDFYNPDHVGGLGEVREPKLLKHCYYFENIQRIGVYVSGLGSERPSNIVLFLDFSFRPSPVCINGISYSYGICNQDGILHDYLQKYKTT